jgi:hypothetical protein
MRSSGGLLTQAFVRAESYVKNEYAVATEEQKEK